MERSYLKVGDKSSVGGTVIEGVPFSPHYGIELTFLGAQVICPACKSTGHIVRKGPRWRVQAVRFYLGGKEEGGYRRTAFDDAACLNGDGPIADCREDEGVGRTRPGRDESDAVRNSTGATTRQGVGRKVLIGGAGDGSRTHVSSLGS
jgi:hypothetical protein